MEFFKGFVQTKNKKCIEKFKDVPAEELHTYNEIKRRHEFAGVLSDDTVLVDIDKAEDAEKMLDIVDKQGIRCQVRKTTRGMHFYFINIDEMGEHIVDACSTNTKLACGLMADIKVGHKNSYAVIKIDNKEREIIYDKLEDEEYQVIPRWMFPVKSRIDFKSLDDGDGRNNAFFKYILTLQAAGFSKDEVRECLRIINANIVPTPLPDDELEVIMRDESFGKPTFTKGKIFLYEDFAKYLVHTCHIIRYQGNLWMYDDGIYVKDKAAIERKMIHIVPGLISRKREETYKFIGILAGKTVELSPSNFIAFKNGVYDVYTDELMPFDPKYVLLNKINVNYNPNAYCEIVDKTLDKLACGDKNIRALLEEAVGYCFYRRNELRQAFVLVGDKANGKSTYLFMIRELLGRENVSALDLSELDKRFKASRLVGKLANIGDDIGDEFIANPATFKKIVSGDDISTEEKGKDEYEFAPYAKLLFSANNIPRMKDKTGAVLSRLTIIPFNATFTREDPDFDPRIKDKLSTPEALEYLARLGVEGLKRVIERNAFTESDKVKQELEEYEEKINPILVWLKDEEPKVENERHSDLYRKYTRYCNLNNLSALSGVEFGKQICKYMGVKSKIQSVEGKKYRFYVRR